jgi:DNA-binding PadR family transcriptional regulator
MHQFSFAALKVFRLFVLSTAEHWYGYRISAEMKMPKRNVYEALHRMTDKGWLEEHECNSTSARKTRVYSLNERGLVVAREALTAVQVPGLLSGST